MSRAGAPKPGSSESRNVTWAIWETFQYLHKSIDEALRPHGITGTQLSLLIRIADQPGLSGADLARRTLTTTQAANLALKALEKKQLIERISIDGDGHTLRASVTDAGHAVMIAGYEAVQELERRLEKNFTKADREQLTSLLRKYTTESG